MKWTAMTLMMGLAACSGGNGASSKGNGASVSGASSLAGSWSGEWRSNSGAGGGMTLTLAQDGSSISGTVSMTDSLCLENAKVTGTVNGDDVEVDVVAGDNHATARLTVTGANQLDGTYAALHAGVCTGDTGMLSASR